MRKGIGVMAATAMMFAAMSDKPFLEDAPIRKRKFSSSGKKLISGSIPQKHAKRHTNTLNSRKKARRKAHRKAA